MGFEIGKAVRALTLAVAITAGGGADFAEACIGNPNLPTVFEIDGNTFTIPPKTNIGAVLDQNGKKIEIIAAYKVKIDGKAYTLIGTTRSLTPSCNTLSPKAD